MKSYKNIFIQLQSLVVHWTYRLTGQFFHIEASGFKHRFFSKTWRRNLNNVFFNATVNWKRPSSSFKSHSENSPSCGVSHTFSFSVNCLKNLNNVKFLRQFSIAEIRFPYTETGRICLQSPPPQDYRFTSKRNIESVQVFQKSVYRFQSMVRGHCALIPYGEFYYLQIYTLGSVASNAVRENFQKWYVKFESRMRCSLIFHEELLAQEI